MNVAADIGTAYKAGGTLAGLWDDAVLGPYTIDGKVVMVPYAADVTNVLWYNKKIFDENNLKAPTTWDEFFKEAETLKARGAKDADTPASAEKTIRTEDRNGDPRSFIGRATGDGISGTSSAHGAPDLPLSTTPARAFTEGLGQRSVRRLVKSMVDRFAGDLPDPLPADLRDRQHFMPIAEAVRIAHYPPDEEEHARARDDQYGVQPVEHRRFVELLVEPRLESQPFADRVGSRERQNRRREQRRVE